ncbi:MAG: MBL fold metallo-hydrolase [Verrucomicrobiota bacterium]|jgi:phosphoribosyl 1,2-cyclic phosphodiesterase
MPAFVKFWGTRGSIPTPASWTRVYGGNTSCVEIRFDDTLFICDAGSGIRELGKDLLSRKPQPNRLHLMISHTHWDHIQGFPYFAPAYLKTMAIHVYGQHAGDHNAYRVLSGQMSSDYFPVSFKDLGASILADHLNGGEKVIEGVRVRSFALNHPGGCFGFCFEKDGRKIVYATDNELEILDGDLFPDLENSGPLRRVPEEQVAVARDADLLILDAQYDEKQYAAKKKWGHSSCFSVTDLAIRAKAKNLALFHHDPECVDLEVDQKVETCRQRAARLGSDLKVFPAREGVELKF